METQKNNFGESNPKEFVTIFSGNENNRAALAVESLFGKADPYDKCPPQQIYSNKYSRYNFTIISQKTAKSANMPVSDLADVKARTEFIRTKLYEMEMNPGANAESDTPMSIAYTQRFLAGEFKGKTPAEVLLENTENQEKLNQQYQILKTNLDKYTNNKKIMDAIVEAASLFKAGKLEKKSFNSCVFNIYTPGFRPLHRKQREDGMCPVYEMSIKCYLNNNYPIEITITNYYAPFTIRENGTINVFVAKMDKSTLIKGTINMTMKDWNNILMKMDEQRMAYVTLLSEDRFKEADRLYSDNMRRTQQTYMPEEE